jgi:hypothetical protein
MLVSFFVQLFLFPFFHLRRVTDVADGGSQRRHLALTVIGLAIS